MYRASQVLVRGKLIADISLLTFINLIVLGNFNAQGVFSRSGMLWFFASIVCWLFSARVLGLYQDFRIKPFSQEWVAFIKSLLLYILLISFIFFHFINQQYFNRPHLLLHCSLIFILIPIQKIVFRIALKRLNRSNNVVRKVLIVGAGEAGINFYKQYVKDEHFGFKLTGFVDDKVNLTLNGHFLGKTSELDEVIANHELDDIIVTLPITKERQIEKIVAVGEKQGKRVRIIPNYSQFSDGKFEFGKLGSLPIITLRSLPLDHADNKIYKRIFDIIFSLLVIVLIFSWLFPIISIIIKLSSKGPVYFKQERWGLNNKVIICYKFRSMVCTSKDVDEKGNYVQTKKNDPRITKIGRFLRKTNLDELPQFFNVFLGSMSIVGPRPHPVPLNMQSKDNVEKYMMRHWVKPGITGWAQVSGYRGETRESSLMRKRVEHDLWYIENWTFWLDLQIILQTLINMVKGEENAF